MARSKTDFLGIRFRRWMSTALNAGSEFPGNSFPGYKENPIQAYILSWTPAELDFSWMPQMNSQEMQLWHSWLLMSNRTSTKMRYVDFEIAQLHFWVSNFWWYWNLPYCHDLEHILKGVPGLDLLVDVEISPQNSEILKIISSKIKLCPKINFYIQKWFRINFQGF